MRGRKPKPSALKRLEGNPGHRKLADDATAPPVNLPDQPEYLTAAARKIWNHFGPKFAALGLMADIDEAAFAMFCTTYAEWIALTELAAKDGPIVRINNQPVPNPYALRADKAQEFCRRWLTEFGGSPSSRSRIHSDKPESVDELASFTAGQAPLRIATK